MSAHLIDACIHQDSCEWNGRCHKQLFFMGPFPCVEFEPGCLGAGDIPEKNPPWYLPWILPCASPSMAMPSLCECIRKAAYDPRVAGLYLHMEPLAIGYARLQVRKGPPLAACTARTTCFLQAERQTVGQEPE
jgi:hypothetical protein